MSPMAGPENGDWIMLMSALGYSIHCRCGWVSLRSDDDAAVKAAFAAHWAESHAGD